MVKSTIRMAKRQAADETESLSLRKRGPGYQMLFFVAVISVFSDNDQVDDIVIDQETNFERYILVLKTRAARCADAVGAGVLSQTRARRITTGTRYRCILLPTVSVAAVVEFLLGAWHPTVLDLLRSLHFLLCDRADVYVDLCH